MTQPRSRRLPILDGLYSVVALGLVLLASCSSAPIQQPVRQKADLVGCYDDERGALPDFMRPPHHWALRISGGVIHDRAGASVSRIGLVGQSPQATRIVFEPGIMVADNEHKAMDVFPGSATSGNAYLTERGATISFADEYGDSTILSRIEC